MKLTPIKANMTNYEQELNLKIEELIVCNMTQRGWNKINSANDVLYYILKYINKHYSDNGNTVNLVMHQ